ncbi:NIPSNAP family protein [Chitinophaga rhizophila]|uniref:NIPSNAP family protein n=1 Tax=Chitinophaga rhizophila TaxID=2866212 RepID=A0ABS7GEH8_9BACT|nr:NIPSNAP family protein [Chitinophaga rhizophila]MBW8685082.1 NIPSNAP family protein [Chitinophaga rhizophila]
MKTKSISLRSRQAAIASLLLFLLPCLLQAAHHTPPKKEYYSILVYHLKDAAQEARMDTYLKDALMPALHKAGTAHVGVFKPVGNDTAADRRIYVLIPGNSAEQLLQLPKTLLQNSTYVNAAKDFIDAAWDNPTFLRQETIILQAFPGMPKMALPGLTGPKSERVYELRSYESPTDKLYRNKVDMFNKGDEVGIFKRLGFNAVFYAEVLSGSRMPNLMYMTTFDNKAARDEHWKAFGADAAWKQLLAKPEYAHNMNKADIIFLQPAPYSDI